jgi:hypothetical protein
MEVVMSSSRTQICGSCRWWDSERMVAASGYCRRHAPRPVVGQDGADADWAVTLETDWCGEWKYQVAED